MKRNFFAFASLVLASTAVMAQEAELKEAKKALAAGDLATAKNQIEKTGTYFEGVAPGKIDNDVQSEYYYTKGEILNGIATSADAGVKALDADAGIHAVASMQQVVAFEKGNNYYAKNISTGDKDYFATQEEMDAAVAAGTHKSAKTKAIKDVFTSKAEAMIPTYINGVWQNAIDNYNAAKYIDAAKYFHATFNLQRDAGQQADTSLVYNAAICHVQERDYEGAIPVYQELLDMGYTGVKTVYEATSVETGEKMAFNSQKDMDLQVKMGQYKDPSSRVTKSVEIDLYKTQAQMMTELGRFDEALAVVEQGRTKYPQDQELLLTEGNIYLKNDNQEAFMKSMEQAAANDPNNPDLWYNIGYVKAEMGMEDEAKAAYDKAVEIDPTYANAYLNNAALILKKEKAINDEISNLGFSSADMKKAKELEAQKKEVYAEAVVYLEKAYEYLPENKGIVETLRNIYYQLGDDANYKKMDDVYNAL